MAANSRSNWGDSIGIAVFGAIGVTSLALVLAGFVSPPLVTVALFVTLDGAELETVTVREIGG